MSRNGGALTFTSESPDYLDFVRNRLSHVDALLRTPSSALYIEGLLDTVQNLVADSSPNAIRNTKNLNLFLKRFEPVSNMVQEFRWEFGTPLQPPSTLFDLKIGYSYVIEVADSEYQLIFRRRPLVSEIFLFYHLKYARFDQDVVVMYTLVTIFLFKIF